MLNSVPTTINKALRAVVLRHPNSVDCFVFRKVVLRTATSSMGGLPTLGNLGVLDSEDESEVDWESIGDGRLLIVENYQPSDMNDRQDNVNFSYPDLVASIEPIVDPTDPAYFKILTHDVVYIDFGDSVKIAFEVITPEGDILIPPHSVRYVLQKRDDLTYINGFPTS